MPSARSTEERDAAVVKKYNELYREGMKKNYVYGLLAKEYDVIPERIAEIIAAGKDLGWEIREDHFKSKPDRFAPSSMPEKLSSVPQRDTNAILSGDVKKRSQRDAAIRRKFRKIYREGMKKYYVYAQLAAAYSLRTERIAEIVRERKQRGKAKRPKSKGATSTLQPPNPKSQAPIPSPKPLSPKPQVLSP